MIYLFFILHTLFHLFDDKNIHIFNYRLRHEGVNFIIPNPNAVYEPSLAATIGHQI